MPPPQLSAPGQSAYDALVAGGAHASPYGKPPIENGSSGTGGGFGGSSGFNNGGAIVRAAMSVLPMENIAVPGASDRAQQVGFPPGPDAAANGSAAPFHDHNALSAAAPEILTQMGYRRAPAFGPEGAWGAGSPRGQQAAPVTRMDSPPVLVLQPGWGVTLPPYFLGMMDAKRPRNVPVKVRHCLLLSVTYILYTAVRTSIVLVFVAKIAFAVALVVYIYQVCIYVYVSVTWYVEIVLCVLYLRLLRKMQLQLVQHVAVDIVIPGTCSMKSLSS